MMVLTMMPSGMWGSTETAWADTSGMSEIRTAEEFAAMETGGNYKLTADITVTAPYPSEFAGTFDGDGHTVTLNITGTGANTGLFSVLGGGATVKNVITTGAIQASIYNNVGGIAGTVNSDGSTITIEGCKNNADITGSKSVGGILGYGDTNNVHILKCANTGAIVASSRQGGGIAGNIEGTFVVEDCYNKGTISDKNSVAGILGRGANGVSVKRCYNTGITGDSGFAIIGSASNRNGKVTIEKCYALSGSAGNFIYSSGIDKDDESAFKTEEYMQSEAFVSLLGSAFMSKAGDYPALTWETPTASVNFNITPANAVLSINGATYTGSCNVALPAGKHDYTVSLDGYTAQSGTVTVTENEGVLTAAPTSVEATLKKDSEKWADVQFTVTPDTATFELKDGETTVQPSEGEKFTYSLLKNHSYSYTATADGYEDESGTYNFETDGPNKTVELKQVTEISVSGYKTVYTQGEQFDRAGLIVTATLSDKTQKEVTEKCTITGFDSSMPIDSQTITVSYKGKTATFGIKIEEKLFPSHVFDGLKGKATVEYSHNNSYKGKDGEEFVDDATENALKSNSAEVNASQVTVAIKFAENLKKSKFRFWYKVSSETKYDYLKINEETGKSISGEIDWTEKGLTVTGGETVTLSYVKDSSGKSGSDCIWLKDFTLEQLYGLTISVKDEAGKAVSGATIVLTDANKNSISGENGVYSLTAGTYAYTVSAFGYKSESGTITVSSEDIAKDITLTKLVSRKATFNVTLPDDLKGKESEISITVKGGETIVKPEADGTYSLPQGEYTYTITHPKCETIEEGFTIEESDVTKNITLIRKLVFSDFFDGLSDRLTATNDTTYPFKAVKGEAADGSDNYLESTNKKPTSGYSSTSTSTLTLEAKAPAKISFDAWYSTYGSDSSYSNYGLLLKKNGVQFEKRYGESSDWENFSVKVTAQDKIAIAYAYYKSYYDSTPYKYCIQLKNFMVTPLTKLTFTDAPKDAVITVKQDGNVVEAETDGSYLLEKGSYTYSVTAFGYRAIEDVALEVSEPDVTSGSKTQTVTMEQEAKQLITFTVTKPDGIEEDATVTVKYEDAVKATLIKDNYSCELPAGKYTYTVTCTGCETETGEFTVGTEAKTVEVTLEKTLTFEDFFTELNGRATVANSTYYKFKPAKEGAIKYLQSSNTSDGTTGIITFTFQKSTKLNFKYMVSEEGSKLTGSEYGLIIKRNNQQIARIEEVSENWKDYSVLAKAGDVITLTYKCYVNDYAMSKDDKDFVRLRDFTAAPLTKVSFEGIPANAVISVKNGDNVIEPVDGSYLLEAGNYSYSVTAFGYMPTTNQALTIAGEEETKTVTVSMTETARYAVSFQVTPSGAAIVVKNEAGETMSALDGNASSYSLPANEKYSYEVSADGYVSKSGYFTADEAKEIKVTLAAAGDAWDGAAKNEPTQKDGIYQISNAAELAWFAAKVSEDATINGELTQNINLNNKEWTSFGAYNYKEDNSGFAGTLDGHGYSIIGLSGKGGLLDCIAPNGKVKNLNVFGKIIGTSHLGGIANTSKGTIENCLFSGTITNTYAGNSAAGIVGRAMSGNIIKNCVSHAEIANTSNGYNLELNLGGIAGYTYGAIENCYFTGSISSNPNKAGNKAIGGIAGQLYAGGILKNSYTIGTVTGPAEGIGSVIGINSGTVENTYVLKNICTNTIAANNAQTGVSIQKKTAEEMRNASFVYALGSAYNQDSEGSINNGFPVLKWQGGSAAVVPEAEQNALADMNAIVIKDKTRADALEAEKKVFTDDDTLKGWQAFYEDDTLTWDDIFAKVGIDLTNDGTLSPDASGVYRLPDSCESLVLPTTGKKGSTIAWRSDAENITISSDTAVVTRPTGENKTVTLTATVTNNNISKNRTFKILLTSAGGAAEETLKQIAGKIENSRAFIQPMQMYDHTNIVQAMQQYLDREGYPVKDYVDQEKGIEVSLVSVGAKSMPQDGIDYIGKDGSITSYYQGTSGFSTTAAIYNDVHFKLSLDGEEKEVTMRVHIGWDVFHVRDMLDKVLRDITWDAIKGENTNAAEDKMVDGWMHTAVSGTINQNLILPKTLSKYSYAKISWTTVKTEDAQYIYAEDNGDGTATGILQRPPKSDNATPNDKGITLRATATFNFWDDYTVQEMTSQGAATEPAESFKFFDVTIEEGTEEEKAAMKEALVNKYPGLIRDFVNKAQTVDLTKVTDDLQMPRPSILEDNGIMSDSYNQHVTMTSSNTDVLQFNGYHAVIYRPLPGEEPETVNYTVTITDRRTKNVLAQHTFKMTILPLTQKEIDDAAAWMKQVCTEDVYWNGIKGENTDKNHITGNLKPFEEILKNADGSIEYIRGAVNITFGGIDVDDLPGYDAMHSQPWREFRTSYQNVIASETLQVTKPEYDTQVTIDSVFTHTEMSKYWEKFNTNEKYIKFKQFYKQPVSVTVTVKGEKGENPNPQPTTMSVTVSVDGKNVNGFKSTSGIVISGLGLNATAWDAVSGALTKAGYKYQNFGDYISGVTDANGVTLTETDTANSGWLYTVNGKLPNVYMGSYYLSDKDNIVLYYTADYTKDPAAGSWAGETNKDVTTSGASGSATTTAPTDVKVSEKTNADGTKETVAAVKIDSKHHDEIIKQAAENKSAEIVLEVSKADSKGADNVQLTLDVTFVKNVADKTNADLTVNTENGKVTLDQETIKTVLAEAKGSTILIEIAKVSKPTEAQKKAAGTNGDIFRLLVKSGDKIISEFNKGKATVRVEIPAKLADKKVAAIHIADDAKIEQLAGKVLTIGGKKFYEFTTPHFSTFALVDAEELGLEVKEEPQVDAKALTAKLTPVARSAKTAKKNVKVTVSLDKQDKAIIKELKDAGYTVKYRFYRSTKKAAGYKAAVTKKTASYTNTSGKKGTKYFYKIQVRVYDENGKLTAKTALKQCKYASRTWTKGK